VWPGSTYSRPELPSEVYQDDSGAEFEYGNGSTWVHLRIWNPPLLKYFANRNEGEVETLAAQRRGIARFMSGDTDETNRWRLMVNCCYERAENGAF